jgi:predicted XRE-type DNA-binding protein
MIDETPFVEMSSGNVFADIGVPNPEEALERARTMSRVVDVIRGRRLSRRRVARILATDERTVSDLLLGKMSRFSLEQLSAFSAALDREFPRAPRSRDETPRVAAGGD